MVRGHFLFFFFSKFTVFLLSIFMIDPFKRYHKHAFLSCDCHALSFLVILAGGHSVSWLIFLFLVPLNLTVNFASVFLFFHVQTTYRFNWREDGPHVPVLAQLAQVEDCIIQRAVSTGLWKENQASAVCMGLSMHQVTNGWAGMKVKLTNSNETKAGMGLLEMLSLMNHMPAVG